MADKTHIQWTDATWNPITGCSIVSKGCTNCYAMQLAGTRLKHHPTREGLTRQANGNHVWTGEVRFNEKQLTEPLRWTKPRRIFVCAHGDLFHENVPDAWIDRVFAVMALTPQHTYQVLTKRPERMRDYMRDPETFHRLFEAMMVHTDAGYPCVKGTRQAYGLPWARPKSAHDWWPLRNVWLGVSIEDQATADQRIPILMQTPAALHWYSGEPLLGEINLRELAWPSDWSRCECEDHKPTLNAFTASVYCAGCCEGAESLNLHPIAWGVVGGENGPRPLHPDWAMSLLVQHEGEEVPFFFKQWGTWKPISQMSEAETESCYRPRVIAKPGQDQSTLNDIYGRRCLVQTKAISLQGRAVSVDAPEAFHTSHGDGWMMTFALGKKAAGDLLNGVQHHNWPEMRT